MGEQARTILVTGHRGFIGARLVEMLLARGYSVRGLDAAFFPPSTAFAQDIRDVTVEQVAGADAVVHLAALSNDPLGDLDTRLTAEINHAAAVRLARLARYAGARRFLLASSCSIYGVSGTAAATEEAGIRPLTAYAASKWRAETDIAALATSAFSPTFLRCATAYGVSPSMRFDVVLNSFVGWAITARGVRLTSDGTSIRPLMHVDDISRVFIGVLEMPRPSAHNQAINVGDATANIEIRQLAAAVGEALPELELAPSSTGDRVDQRSYRVDFAKLRRLLPAFQPEWSIAGGIRQVYGAFRGSLSSEDFLGPRYIRVRQLEHLIAIGAVDAKLRWKSVERSSTSAS